MNRLEHLMNLVARLYPDKHNIGKAQQDIKVLERCCEMADILDLIIKYKINVKLFLGFIKNGFTYNEYKQWMSVVLHFDLILSEVDYATLVGFLIRYE